MTRSTGLLRALRIPEVGLMLGFPAAAGVYGMSAVDEPTLMTLVSTLFALFWIALSVYAFNAWAGIPTDVLDPKFRRSRPDGGEVIPGQLLGVAVAAVALGLGLSALLSWRMATVVAVLWAAWVVYSHPAGLKGLPFAGTVLHLVAGVLMFLIPYALQGELDGRGMCLAVAMAFAFSSGHANHEAMDREADAAGGVRTTAVVFGPRIVHVMGLGLAAASYLVIAAGWLVDVLSWAEAAPLVAAGPIHLGLGIGVLKTSGDRAAHDRYRRGYRLVFGLAVLISLALHVAAI